MRMRPGALLLIVALVATACGGGDEASTPAAPVEQASATDGPAPAEPTATQEPVEADASPTATSTPAATPVPTPEPIEPVVTLAVPGLPVLSGDATYEVWLTVDGSPVSVGTSQDLADVTFPVGDHAQAEAVIVTVEVDDDPAPSTSRVLAGPLADGVADLAVTDPAAIGADFAVASGSYILATPTDGTGTPENERSGIWWTFIPRAQSLVLPALPAGWTYEGWQIIDGIPVTTGTFSSPFGIEDDAAPFSGPQPGPPFPGEDFLVDAPDGLTFPRDLRGTEVVISIEPVPDTGAEPFGLVPLRGTVPADAVDHVAYEVQNAAADLPIGTATLG